jgi:regulator of sigma E protease
MNLSDSRKSCGDMRGCGAVSGPTITPKLIDGTYKIGVGIETVSKQQLSFGKAFVGAGNSLWNIISSTWNALGDLGHKLLRGQKGSLDNVSGPVGLVATGSKMLKTDLIQTMLMLFVVLSANLALLNLLPIPALDGGQVVISVIRKIIPAKYGSKVHSVANIIGAILLFALIAIVTFKDVVGLFK